MIRSAANVVEATAFAQAKGCVIVEPLRSLAFMASSFLQKTLAAELKEMDKCSTTGG